MMSRSATPLPLTVLDGDFSIHQLASRDRVPPQALAADFSCLLALNEQVTLICPGQIPVKALQTSRRWRVLKVDALLDHSLVGILAGISRILADADVSIFALSSWETDFVLVQSGSLDRACRALEAAGHEVNV